MEKIYLPDYKGGSIVNLMSSISHAFNVSNPYRELRYLSSNEIKRYKNVVLIVIDGLGYEFLNKKHESFLKQNMRAKITSVFPPTTASGITTFFTGFPAQQHALTGWFVYLKELGIVAMILPFCPRIGGTNFDKQGYQIEEFMNVPALTSRIKAKSFIIQSNDIKATAFTKAATKKAKIFSYKNLNQFFKQIERAIRQNNKKYIYAYWPKVDSLAHDFGVGSNKYERHFKELDKKFRRFAEKIRGSDTLVIVTADHGLINSSEKQLIKLENHPKLKECLTLPFSGEGRLPYCYVRPNKVKQFEKYVRNNLSKYCWMFKSEELVKKNFFGLGKPNPKLFDRIGDYVLIMKENYLLKDQIEIKKKFHIGNHGGISKEEMFVPLIVLKG